MKGFSVNKKMRSLILVLFLVALTASVIFIFGCVPPVEKAGPQIDQARQKAVQDSLQQIYNRKLAIYNSTGYEYYKNKMYRNCIKPLLKVVELDTSKRYKNTYTYLADAYIQLNKADSAQIVLEMGTKAFPDNAYLHRNLGYIYSSRGMTEEAIARYETALSLDDTQVDDWKQVANLYIKNDQEDEAIKAYEKVTSLNPKDQDAQRTLSKLYKSSGDADAAIQRMEEVKKLDPKNTDNLFNLAKEYFNKDDFDNALVNFKALLQLKPNDALALSYLGASFQNSGKFNDAITTYKKAIDIQPDNKKLQTDVATCYKELCQFSTARNYANKALKIDVKYGLANIVRGEIYEAAAEKCMASRGKSAPEFDDKLIFELAYNEYKKAAKDLQFKDIATAKMNYVKDFIPKKEDRFFHKHSQAKLKCYKWIY